MLADADTIRELTGYQQPARQAEVLSTLGIPYKMVRGRVRVLAAHVVAYFNGTPMRQTSEPNLGAVK